MTVKVGKTYREDTKKSIQNTIKILTIKCLYHVLPCKGLTFRVPFFRFMINS